MIAKPLGSAMRTGKWNDCSASSIEAVQARAAAAQNESGGNLRVEAGALQFVANQREQFLRARLDDVGEHARENGARRTIADAGDFDGAVFLQAAPRRRNRDGA